MDKKGIPDFIAGHRGNGQVAKLELRKLKIHGSCRRPKYNEQYLNAS